MSRKKILLTWLLGGALMMAMSVVSMDVALAETIKARRTTSVFAAPGEKSKTLTRVLAGKTMTVLRRDGRWIKVRVNGLTGWITRSNTEAVAARSAPQKNRKVSFVEGRSRKDSSDNAPDDRIGADAVDGAKDDIDDEDLSDLDDSAARSRAKQDREAKREKAKERRAKQAQEKKDRDAKAAKDKRAKERAAKKKKARSKNAKAKKSKRVAARERKARKRNKNKKRKADEFEDEDEDDDEDEFEDDGDGDDGDDDEMVVVVAEEAELYSKPSKKAKSVNFAENGDKLLVVERDGKWILVETDDGDEGWVRASDVGSSGFSYQKVSKTGFAELGFRNVSQTFVSDSVDPLGNYQVSSGAAVVGVGGDLIYDYSEKYLLGAEAAFGYTRANPGVRFTDPMTMQPVDISFTILQAKLVAKGGYKISDKNGMAAYLRVGYHYEKFDIANVTDFDQNTARLPSEIFQGATVGASLDIPRFNPKWSGKIGLDYMSTTTIGKRTQTQGLEDGNLSSVSALWGSARVRYQWKSNMQLSGMYQYAQATTDFEGRPVNSQRRHIANDAGATCAAGACNRKDVSHSLFFGILRSF